MIDSWHDWLAKDGWLKPQELQQAEDLHAHAKDQKDYADQLVKNGLISSFQANHLLAGTVANLDCGRYRLISALEPHGAFSTTKSQRASLQRG